PGEGVALLEEGTLSGRVVVATNFLGRGDLVGIVDDPDRLGPVYGVRGDQGVFEPLDDVVVQWADGEAARLHSLLDSKLEDSDGSKMMLLEVVDYLGSVFQERSVEIIGSHSRGRHRHQCYRQGEPETPAGGGSGDRGFGNHELHLRVKDKG